MNFVNTRKNKWKVVGAVTSICVICYIIVKPTEVIYSERDITQVLGPYVPLRDEVTKTVEEIQRERIRNIRNMCNYSTLPLFTEEKLKKLKKQKNIIVDDKHKTLYCFLPKVGCTSWKVKLAHSSGLAGDELFNTHPSVVDTESGLAKYGIYPLYRFSPDQIKYRVQNYFKFMFVRHPMERVLSAYRSKWEKRPDNVAEQKYFYQNYYNEIVNIARHNKSDRVSMISFPEFVNYIIHKAKRNEKMEDHWERYYEMCQLCTIDYDFVGKFDTLVDDVAFVLRKIYPRHDDHYFPNVSAPRSAVKLLEKYYSKLDNSVIDKLEKVYSRDNQLFGYDFNTVLH